MATRESGFGVLSPTRGAAGQPAPGAFVGRDAELRQLTNAVEGARQGRGTLVVLQGDAGIGKTRLAHEALARARTRGFLVLEGRAYPVEGGLAYAPFLDAFGSHLRGIGLREQGELTRDLRDLGPLFPELALPGPAPLPDPALAKTRLFDTLARLLARLAQRAPVVVFLDDLHWADRASLELLHYLARGITGQRVLILGAYRDEDPEGPHLRRVLDALARAGMLQEVPVPGLESEAVQALARGHLDGEPSSDLLAFLESRASGRPLFVEALLRSLADTGRLGRTGATWTLAGGEVPLPRAIRGLLLERLERLDPSDQRLVELLAVAGSPVPHRVLAAAAAAPDEDTLLASLRRLRAARLVAEGEMDGEVAYALDYPLIQEAVYGELPEVARRRIHAALAMSFERLRPDDVGHLAVHYRGGGSELDRDRALEIFLAAGERARAVYANQEAARHFQAALELVRQGRRQDLLPGLLEKLGDAWERLGERGAAVAVWSEAVAAHQMSGDVPAAARVRHRLALAEWERGRIEAAHRNVADGIEALAAREPSAELAELYVTRALFSMRLGAGETVEAAAADLGPLAERLQSPRISAQAHLVEALSSLRSAAYPQASAAAERLLALAEGEPLLTHYAYHVLANAAVSLGDHRLARQHGERGLAHARRVGAATLECYPYYWFILAEYLAGDWDRALASAAAFLALAQRLGLRRNVPQPLALQAILHARRGELDRAAPLVHQAREILGDFPGDRHIGVIVNCAETVLAVEQRNVEAALQAAADMDVDKWHATRPLGWALLAEVYLLAGRPDTARRVARSIAALGTSEHLYPAALADQVEGLAAQALGETAGALAHLRRAADLFRALEIPFELARCQLAWAGLAANHSDVAEVADAAREAAEIFERRGARPYAGRAKALLRRLGVRPAPPRAGTGQLSARELEVVQLAAAGLTAEQMAERLVVSPHTVIAHLKRIYQRFGIHSRAALVRHAEQAGWLEHGAD